MVVLVLLSFGVFFLFFLIEKHSGFTIMRIFFGFIASIACKGSTFDLYFFMLVCMCSV